MANLGNYNFICKYETKLYKRNSGGEKRECLKMERAQPIIYIKMFIHIMFC